MENKYVGYLLLGISIFVIFLLFLFNSTLKEIIGASCGEVHEGELCPMNQNVDQQTYIALGVTGLLIIVSIVLIFSKPQKEVQKEIIVQTKTIEKKTPKKIFDTTDLKPEEKQVLELIKDNKAIFQADLIEKTGFGKAKMTRIIDRLEGKNFVERKRRGMTNVVVLKE
ncbi:MarR family transcriptional regulator [Candidatus Woesearchaeota archaeon]|nr:MarR family transcriptional regulator [Candidatus Woesearchaeota archaeon]